MSQKELSTTYSSNETESKWYPHWESNGYFKPREGKTGESYCIIMPPPNVTGQLHMGHALDVTTQDALIRFKRMKGFKTLYLPGMDHAGIATQAVVEKMLDKEGTSRHELGREKFLEKTWEWKEKYGGVILNQQRKLGASPDWDYSLFTMDDESNEAVKKVFVDLYNEGLIYQSDYIVNWDPVLESAISDAEVEYKEVKGNFYHLLYPVVGSDEKLEIATTRPETMLGDTAVCVHPEDERFKHLIGKKAIVPLCNREVPIIADEHVDMELGTGCLKVTPGHDFNDFEIGKRHNLEIINILNKDGTLNEYGLEWKGLTCAKARTSLVQKLEEKEILVKVVEHVHQVGHGDRSKAIIEPMVSKQWFLNIMDMAAESVKAVEEDVTTFWPKQWENTYFSWLRNPRNWCVSRQLWWGHQIPVFNCTDCNNQWADAGQPTECPKCLSKNTQQDPDVLDTWFSSGLWPLSTLGWPNEDRMKEKGFNDFFPTSCLVTGHDIIFFWVARMMMFTQKITKKIPFHHVYIHAIVRDKQGRKMSKSLGNGIDPLEVIEQYGADALRYTLAAGSGYNRDLNLDPAVIESNRNFINKIWNAFRFIHPYLENAPSQLPNPNSLSHQEKWILSELNTVIKNVNESMEQYRFDDSCSEIYSFVYDKFCSWFIELSKKVLNGENEELKNNRAAVLKYAFRELTKILHPFAPFITEELWTYLKTNEEELLIVTDFPEFKEELAFEQDKEEMNYFIQLISGSRNLRSSVGLSPKEKIELQVFTDKSEVSTYFKNEKDFIIEMANASSALIHDKSKDRPKKSLVLATENFELFIPVSGVIDLDQQVSRLQKDLDKTTKELAKVEKKLNNPKFISSAPDEIVSGVKSDQQDLLNKAESLKKSIKQFS